MCVLLGYGADGICPYMVFEAAHRLRHDGVLAEHFNDEEILKVFRRLLEALIAVCVIH